MIAALYVQKNGCYWGLYGVEAWDESRDARVYTGPHPVVAHPPCHLWVNLAHVNYKRYGGEHNQPGNDGGCFASALNAVRTWGGVLEHPAFSNAWLAYRLTRPQALGWQPATVGSLPPSAGWRARVGCAKCGRAPMDTRHGSVRGCTPWAHVRRNSTGRAGRVQLKWAGSTEISPRCRREMPARHHQHSGRRFWRSQEGPDDR